MFDFLRWKKKKAEAETADKLNLAQEEQEAHHAQQEIVSPVELPLLDAREESRATSENEKELPVPSSSSRNKGFFNRLKSSLSKTRKGFTESLANLLLGKKTVNQELLEAIEEQLIMADIGVSATERVIQRMTQMLSRKELQDSIQVMDALRNCLLQILAPCEKPLIINKERKPYVILMVGINGAGKTTTIGKLGCYFKKHGLKVMFAAGDTFRAAAIQQLQTWGERNDIPVVAQQTGADSASVLYDALAAAKARNTDVLLADTAGRLHTQSNLMEELKKVKRVLQKLDPEAPHEVLLVLDAVTGQNGLNQALQFHQAVGLSGIALTKLDGTAKGGVIFAIAETLQLPIRFIGIGEGIDDLRPFQANDFLEALFTHDDSV